jgi:hypothetical protein
LSENIAPSAASLLGAIGRHYAPPMAAPHYAATAITTGQSPKRRRETLQEELARGRTFFTPQ